MLGTGIASADEDVNPDKPASPLDGSVTVPVHIDNNALGTPLGQKALPNLHKDVTVRVSDLTGAVPATPVTDPFVAGAMGTAAPAVGAAQGVAAPLPEAARDQSAPLATGVTPVTEGLGSLPTGGRLPAVPSLDSVNLPALDKMSGTPGRDNRVNLDLVAPVDISGNAIALLGHAATTNYSQHAYGTNRDVYANGSGGALGGNVVDLDWALPVQVTNNAGAVLGKASAAGMNRQEAWATGDIVSSGAHSLLGGNVVAPQFATPVQVDGNALAGGGQAAAISKAKTSGEAGGSILTDGFGSVGGGNAVPVPVAVPARLNGNAVPVLGKAFGASFSSAEATAGDTRKGVYGVPTYVQTNGSPALAAGNIVQPAVSGPVMLCGNAGAVGGLAKAVCKTATTTEAGGTSRTNGAGSLASGAVAAAPVALPVEGFGNAVAAVGKATAIADNKVESTAGGGSYTRGHDSVLGGTAVAAPVSGVVDVFANSGAVAGCADSFVWHDATSETGGYTGTTGDNSLVGGNMVTSPIAAPAEVFGNAVAGLGAATATGEETKTITAGGATNAADDNGVLASNVLTAPVATAAQVFGNGAGALATTNAAATADNYVTSGGYNRATGVAGVGSGNLGQVPVSAPLQVFGSGASALAKGTQAAINQTDMQSGGDNLSIGDYGTGSGNVVTAPVGGAGQVFGESVAALGLNKSVAGSQTETEAGGDTWTSGHGGLLSGNVAAPQALPLVQTFGTAVSAVGGHNFAVATNDTEAESGGDISTNGDKGFLSGNLLDVPAAAAAQPFGDAVAVLGGRSYALGANHTEGEVGGTSHTSGVMGSLSGIDGTLPVAANAPVYDVPVEILADAMTEAVHYSDLAVGETEPQVNLPVTGGMSPTELPTFATQRSTPVDAGSGAFTGTLPSGGFTDLAQAPRILPAPAMASTGDPAGDLFGGLLGGAGAGDLPGLGGLTGGGFGGRSDVPASMPTDMPADLTEITTVMPAVPAMADITSVPIVQAPSVGALPVPGVSEVAAPELGGSSLDSTRAALENVFGTHPIA